MARRDKKKPEDAASSKHGEGTARRSRRSKKKDDAPVTPAQPQGTAFKPVLPEADLLPHTYREKIALRNVRSQITGIAGIAAVVFAVLFAAQQGLIMKANFDLTEQRNEASVLQSQKQQYLPVRAYFGQIESNTAQIVNNMRKDVATSRVMETLYSSSSGFLTIQDVNSLIDTTVGGTQNAVAPATTVTEVFAGCPQIDLFDAAKVPAVGCVQIGGTAQSRDRLSEWIESLGENKMFISPFISDSTANEDGITFTASVGLTADVFSFRYTDDFVKGN